MITEGYNKSALKRPINVIFEIPYFTVSSITVRYLKIIERSGYQVCTATHSLYMRCANGL